MTIAARLLLAVPLLMLGGHIDAKSAKRPTKYFQTSKELQRQWLVMETECRGGQHDPGDAICRERNSVGKELERRGICWAYSDWRVFPFDYAWHPCSQARPKGWKPDK